MDTFDKWFSRFMWGTDIVFLTASMPHIAAWFAHFDNPTDFWSGLYAWGVGFALAFAIDGVSFMLLLAITRMIKQGKTKNGRVMFGLFAFMTFIALLSWGINIQYDIQFASDAFARADAIKIPWVPLTVGQLNPIIGGAFQVLILAYALISKAMQGEVKPVKAMSDAEFEEARRAKLQKQALKDLDKNDNETGLFAGAKERIFGKEKDADELYRERLNAAVDYLRNATDLLDRSQEQKAIELLAVFLKVNKKEAVVYLEAVRPILLKEKEQASALKTEENALPDKLQMTIDFLAENGMNAPDESLAEFLGFQRVASCLFWKSKALAIIQQNPSILQQKRERITGPLTPEFREESEEEFGSNPQENHEDLLDRTDKPIAIPPDLIGLINLYPKFVSLLDKSAPTIVVEDVATIFKRTPVFIKNRADAGEMSYVKGRKKVTKISVIDWAKKEMIGKGKGKVIDIESARNSEENEGEIQDEKVSG